MTLEDLENGIRHIRSMGYTNDTVVSLMGSEDPARFCRHKVCDIDGQNLLVLSEPIDVSKVPTSDWGTQKDTK